MKKLSEYKAVVFDLDGTLYYQRRLRLKMAWMLFSYYLCHFWRLKELLIVKKFREVREKWDGISGSEASGSLEDEQYAHVAAITGSSPGLVKDIVEEWIYKRPLKAVYDTRDVTLLNIIKGLRDKDIPVFIFSDYPIEEKAAVLGVSADGMYAATDERLNELKPSPKGLNLIMSDHSLTPADIIMVGDRMSRDGLAAQNAGCEYLILPKSRLKREKLYKKI
ncbi:MAG: HAD family hydrolase [Lachnospiraceae bacterium]|nr:HAD family hydrolase [Lachnospiraceae bacterium]